MQKALIVLLSILTVSALFAHEAHDDGNGHDHDRLRLAQATVEKGAKKAGAATVPGVTGQGEFKFRLNKELSKLPPEAVKVLRRANGGFGVDRQGDGSSYFALPGCGVVKMSPDLKTKSILKTAPGLKNINMHDITVFYHDDKGYLAMPAEGKAKIFITDLDGKEVATLNRPAVNDYYKQNKPFKPTSTAFRKGTLFVADGYAGNYILTADPLTGKWSDLVFGGKGKEDGKFGTAHGIAMLPDGEHLEIADRAYSRLERFQPAGKFLQSIKLPPGSMPCSVDFFGEYAIVGCLKGEGRKTPAPIYILKDGKVISTIRPMKDLGLKNFKHVHNAAFRVIDGRFYLLCMAWNPGDVAILEQVK